MSITRRDFISTTGLSALALLGFDSVAKAYNFILPADDGTFNLPKLPYAYEALEPFIDAQTMTIHHTKHHQAYINKLNEAVAKEPSLKGKTLEQLVKNINNVPESVRSMVRNHGGGHWNHTFFWTIMTDKKDSQPSEILLKTINEKFKSMDNFKAEFEKAALSVFGSGWAWVVKDQNYNLEIVTTHNQDNPLMDIAEKKGTPILGVDVWEHAYYLKYHNVRPDYLKNWWHVVNWEMCSYIFAS